MAVKRKGTNIKQKIIVNNLDEPVYRIIMLISPIPPIQHFKKKLGLYLTFRLIEIRVISLRRVFDAESSDVTAKANIVKAVRI